MLIPGRAVQGRAYNLYDPSLGQTMNSALLAAIYGDSIQPNVSTIPGVVRRSHCTGWLSLFAVRLRDCPSEPAARL